MKGSDKKINYEIIERKKIIFQFFLVSIFSFVGGILFVNLVSDEFLSLIALNVQLGYNANIGSDFFDLVLRNSLDDIAIIITLYVFSFSFINYLVSDLALSFLGFKTGLCVHTYFLSDISYFKLFALLSIKMALLTVVLLFACALGVKTLRLIKYRINTRVRLDRKCFASITILTVSTAGAIIVLNAVGLLI